MRISEKGFTLIELLVALPIMALAALAVGGAIYEIANGTGRNSNHLEAVLHVQGAGDQITKDVSRSQISTTTNLTTPVILTTSWVSGTTGDLHVISYTMETVSGSSMKTLYRKESINGAANVTMMVAQDIEPTTSANYTGGIFTLTVTATVGGARERASETKTYQIVPRPD